MRLPAIFALPLLVAAPAIGHDREGPRSPVGRSFHYERTNIDGSDAEQVYLHRAAPDRVEVYKMRERCERAAIVTAIVDPATGEASLLEAGQLRPNAQRLVYATLSDDRAGNRLKMAIGGDSPVNSAVPVGTRPWHDFDYDLGTLAVAFQSAPGSRATRHFGMSLAWPDAGGAYRITWLGDVALHFVRAERHLGTRALRFAATGNAFGDKGGGPIWVDARGGHIVDVQWGRPNHKEYNTFRLRLIAEVPGGARGWTDLLRRHFEGCPG